MYAVYQDLETLIMNYYTHYCYKTLFYNNLFKNRIRGSVGLVRACQY